MSLAVSFHRAAKAEFIEASAWYEDRRQGLGLEFIAEIEHCLLLAAEQPSLFAIVHTDIRHVVVNRFPYSIYFRAEAHRIAVLAVFHGRRDPAIWQDRILPLP